MSLAERDEALLVAPSRTFVLEYDRPRSLLGRWFWRQRIRRSVTLRTLTLRELQQIQRAYRMFEEKHPEGLDMTVALALIIGTHAYHLTPGQLSTLWAVHCELNHIPFGVATEEKKEEVEPSPTQPSSVASNGGHSTTDSATSST